MTDAQFGRLGLERGRKYRIGMYCATSTSRPALAGVKQWQEADSGRVSKYEWIFTIPAGCLQATSISAVSQHHENEVLIVPYSAILVTKIMREVVHGTPVKYWIYANVLPDSMNEAFHLPSILV